MKASEGKRGRRVGKETMRQRVTLLYPSSLGHKATREMIVHKECHLVNLSRETLERWYGEVEILKRLDHPNIVKAQNVPEGLNCSPMSNTLFICIEYCDSGDLRQVRKCVCGCVCVGGGGGGGELEGGRKGGRERGKEGGKEGGKEAKWTGAREGGKG